MNLQGKITSIIPGLPISPGNAVSNGIIIIEIIPHQVVDDQLDTGLKIPVTISAAFGEAITLMGVESVTEGDLVDIIINKHK